MKDLLVKIGKFCIENTPYDAVGVSSDKQTLSIGYQNNLAASILLTIDDKSLQISFHAKISKYEAFMAWFQFLEHIQCKVIVMPDFK